MDEKLRSVFAKMRLIYSVEDFLVVGLPGVANVAIGGEGFSCMIKEKGETTLILPVEKWGEIESSVKGARIEGPFRVITFDFPLEFSLVGFMAEVSRVLAGEGVSILAISAYTHDHILVKSENLQKSLKALEKMILECKEGQGEKK